MALRVTEKSSVRRLSLRPPWTAHREFYVSNDTPLTESQALGAIDSIDATKKIPPINSAHDYAPILLAGGPLVIERNIPGTWWLIGTDYTVPSAGQLVDQNTNPLLQPTKIRWFEVPAGDAVDHDLDSRPLVYGNGQPIEGLSGDDSYLGVTLTKNFPYWVPTWASDFRNTTNKLSVPLVRGPTVAPHHMLIKSVIPATEIVVGAQFVQVACTIHVVLDDSRGTYPFQYRVIDQGTEAYNADGNRVRLHDEHQDLITTARRFGGNGKPFAGVDDNDKLKVFNKDGKTEVAPQTPPNTWTAATNSDRSDGTVLDKSTLTYATIGWFKKARIIDVIPFLTLFN